jgi:hypothetical protein
MTIAGFFSTAFQASLATEAIIFAAFGFLYAAYCQYSTVPPPPPPPPGHPPGAYPGRAAIANRIAFVCKTMVGLIALNAIIAIYSLVRLGPAGFEQIVLSMGFGMTMITLVVVSAFLAYRM